MTHPLARSTRLNIEEIKDLLKSHDLKSNNDPDLAIKIDDTSKKDKKQNG